MAHQHDGSRLHAHGEQELWFNMPTSSRQHTGNRTPEQSAYRSTTNRMSSGSASSTSSRPYSNVPSISTTADTNKPLPPSPPASDGKKRRSSGLRTILGRPPAIQQDSNYLQPQPYVSNSRYSATTNDLSINTQSPYHHTYSRSMPSSPYEHHQNSTSPNPANLPRAHSSAADYPESMEYQPYNPVPQASYQPGSVYPVWSSRSTSSNNYFETIPPRASTFPAEGVSSPTLRESVSSRPRPHTWLSPTESFSDASQYSLFAQATTGLPDESDPFSPNGPPQLQGSLFARRSANDTIPMPPQRNEVAHGSYQTRTDWQNFEPPSFSSRSVSAPVQQYQDPAHISRINRELELLGLEDGSPSDDELPNYAQSQAEAHARRRQEASARARELEARWRSTRGR